MFHSNFSRNPDGNIRKIPIFLHIALYYVNYLMTVNFTQPYLWLLFCISLRPLYVTNMLHSSIAVFIYSSVLFTQITTRLLHFQLFIYSSVLFTRISSKLLHFLPPNFAYYLYVGLILVLVWCATFLIIKCVCKNMCISPDIWELIGWEAKEFNCQSFAYRVRSFCL